MPLELFVTLAAVFVSVALASGSVASLVLSRTGPERKRFRHVTAPVRATARLETLQRTGDPSPILRRFARSLPTSAKSMARVRRRLAAAGCEQFGAALLYAAAQIILPVAVGLVLLLILGLRVGWAPALIGAFLGYMTPDLALAQRTARHKQAIQNGLPDALDLLVVCMEAGSSLDQAILKASVELDIAMPALAHELRVLAGETRAGKSRIEAFQDLARRTDVEDVRALVAMLIQTDRFGTSVAQALRTHAETARSKRRQRAEERASTVGVKLVFPLVLCLVPALYVVCLGPVVVRLYRAFP